MALLVKILVQFVNNPEGRSGPLDLGLGWFNKQWRTLL
jgi:hypothetical protein